MNQNHSHCAPPVGVELAGQMKDAMRRLAKSVVIVTTRYQGQRMAMAATAVDSLSLEPPSLLVCVNRSASIFPALSGQAAFCFNILARTHEPLAHLCGGKAKGEARFEQGAWGEGPDGVPCLEDAQASIFCRTDGEFFYGTHGIFIGRVDSVRLHGPVEPLIYADARYGGALLSAA